MSCIRPPPTRTRTNWREDIATNVEGTINVVEAARAASVRRFVNFQTVLVLWPAGERADSGRPSARPFTSYGISKVAGEQYLAMSGLPFVSLRLANVTGAAPGDRSDPDILQAAEGRAELLLLGRVRDFLDMSDFFAVVDIAMAEDAPTGIFNVASGLAHSIKEIYDIVRQHVGIS